MSLQRVNPASLPRPSGFTHAIVAQCQADGRVVFLAGQTATDSSGAVVQGGVAAQFAQALANLLTALRAAGGQPADLASLTIYAVDLDDYRANAQEIGAAWRQLAGPDYPAMAAVGVSRLWEPTALVELQGYAVIS
jgi:enamine deaminase RidA (YjgF/YER057c/UK114 family)